MLAISKTAKYVGGQIYTDFFNPKLPNYPNWVQPGYSGHDYISVSSITVGTVDVMESTREVPFMLHASAKNVTCSASRTNGVGSVYPYTMLEHSWTLTYSDGTAIDWTDTLTGPMGEFVNPYVDFKSPEYAVPIRKPGTYTLTLRVRGPGIEASNTATITASVPTYGHEWIDASGGDDLNDGLDPWGFGTTTASYTESTGVLSQTNAFTSYDHTAATAGNPTDWYNWIYISGGDGATTAGWYRIASKTDNSNIVLEDKLGADDTNVTSSDGPKQTFTGAARTAQSTGSAGNAALDRHDIFLHLNSNQGASSYTFTESFSFALGNNAGAGWGDVHKFIGGYNAPAAGCKILGGAAMNTAGEGADSVLYWGVSEDGNLPRFFGAHNLDIDGQNNAISGMSGTLFDAGAVDDSVAFFDRISVEKCEEDVAQWNGTTTQATNVTLGIWEMDVDNTRQANYINSGTATGGSSTTCIDTGAAWTTDEFVPHTLINTTTNCVGRITGNTATTITVTDLTGGSRNTFENTDGYAIGYEKEEFLIGLAKSGTTNRLAIVGGQIKTDSDNAGLNHFIYPSFKNHGLFAYIYFQDGGIGGGPNFCLNTTFDGGSSSAVCDYTSIVECYSDGGSSWFADPNGTSNDPSVDGTFENLLIARNAIKSKLGFVFAYGIGKAVIIDNVFYGDGTNTAVREFFTPNDTEDLAATDYVLARNKAYGNTAIEYLEHITSNSKAELVDNDVHNPNATAVTQTVDFTLLTNRYYLNNYYAPSDSDGNIIVDHSGPTTKTLASFNTATGTTNTSTDPGWTDPANGDFR